MPVLSVPEVLTCATYELEVLTSQKVRTSLFQALRTLKRKPCGLVKADDIL